MELKNIYKPILIILLLIISPSCNSKKEQAPDKIKILPKKEAKKILKEEKPIKPQLKEKKVEGIILETNKGKTLKVGSNTYKNLEKNLEKKKGKETVKIKKTLEDLEFLKYKTDISNTFDKENNLKNKSISEIDIHISDKIRSIFKPMVNKYSLRHLKFENNANEIKFGTISLNYENKKKRIHVEVIPLSIKPLIYIKEKHKDFFYKNYKLGDIQLHLSMNYKLKLINGVFNHLSYTWIVTAQNVKEITDVIEIVRSINFNLFMELNKKHEEE